MIDLKRARILREVAAQGSFSEAANELHLSQSAVSQHVSALEREVGATLLERTPKGPKPTEAGRVLITHAEAAIARLDEAERELAALAGLEAGEVRIASFPSASATLLTEAVSCFRGRHPEVRLALSEAEPEDSLPMLRAGEVDLSLVFDYPAVPFKDDRDVEFLSLMTESMYVALPHDHALAGADGVDLTQLQDENWLGGIRPSSCDEAMIRACRDAGFEPRISFESDDYHVLQGFVAAGLGVTLLPDLALPTLRADLVMQAVKPVAPQRRVWAAVRPEGARAPATEAMVEVLREVAEKMVPAPAAAA